MKKEQPLVTLGIPTYNSEAHVERLLTSVQAQTYANLQVVIIDNHSQDRTVERIRPFLSDERFSLIESPKNMGSSYSLKRLVLEGKGDFFAWIASDFAITADFVAKQLTALQAHPDVDLVYPSVLLTLGEKRVEHRDGFSLMQEEPEARLGSLYAHLDLGTAVYGLSRASLYRELFLCPPTGFVPMWTSSRFFRFGDLQLLTFIVLKTKVLQLKDVLVERDRTGDARSYPDNLARLERFFQHQRTNVGLPSFVGLNEILVRLFQMPFEFDAVMRMSALVMRTLLSKFGEMFEYEIRMVCDAISKQEYGRAWDPSYTEMNLRECPTKQGRSIEYLRYIYDDLHIASLYSEDERILLAHRVCAERLGIKG